MTWTSKPSIDRRKSPFSPSMIYDSSGGVNEQNPRLAQPQSFHDSATQWLARRTVAGARSARTTSGFFSLLCPALHYFSHALDNLARQPLDGTAAFGGCRATRVRQPPRHRRPGAGFHARHLAPTASCPWHRRGRSRRHSSDAHPPGPRRRYGLPGPRKSTACRLDRKSTRLNSSHPSISYAVFCLKKKKNYDMLHNNKKKKKKKLNNIQ